MVHRFINDRAALVGVALVTIFLLVSVWGLFGTPADTNRSRLGSRLQAPSAAHVLGTDGQGRDIKNRVLQGCTPGARGRRFLSSGRWILGCALGLVAGYYRKKVGAVIMRLVDALLAFPTLAAGARDHGDARRWPDEYHDRGRLLDLATLRSFDGS